MVALEREKSQPKPLSAENLSVRTRGQMRETEAQRGSRLTQRVGMELGLSFR